MIKQYAKENPAKHVITKVQQNSGGVSDVTSVSTSHATENKYTTRPAK